MGKYINSDIEEYFRKKIISLQNDCNRAFIDLAIYGLQPSPFPILMYVMSFINFFGSALGYKGKHTDKLKKFCINDLGYGTLETEILIKNFRNILMHNSEPKTVKNLTTTFGWRIEYESRDHMKLAAIGKDVSIINLGIKNIIDDINTFLEYKYIPLLKKEKELTDNFNKVMDISEVQQI